MIEIRHLTKRYPSNKEDTLHDINLDLGDTGLVYIIGKSGAGKSTLLHILGLMDRDYEGSVKVDGEELKEIPDDSRYRFEKIGFVFQSLKAEETESVKDNLLRALAITDLSSEEKEERIHTRLAQVDLADREKSLFRDLSGGEKKRVSLVRALIRDAPILLADEPLSSLNHNLRVEITKILLEESKSRLVIVITHEKEEIPKDASVFELKNGNLNKVVDSNIKSQERKEAEYNRKKFGGFSFLHQLFFLLKSKSELLMVTVMALTVGLFSIALSFQLSGSVSAALVKSMSSYMDENTMVVDPKEQGATGDGFLSGDVSTIDYLANRYPEHILSPATFYESGFNTIFSSQQVFSLHYYDNAMKLSSLSLDSFVEYRLPEEIEGDIYGSITEEKDEVILATEKDNLYGLYQLIFNYLPYNLDESTLNKLGHQLANNPISLQVQCQRSDWGYIQDYTYRVTGFLPAEKTFLISPREDFANHFVTDVMHFKEALFEEEIPEDTPWTIRKREGFRLYPDKISDFLPLFLRDRQAEGYTLLPLKSSNYYDEKDYRTHNHFALLKDCLPKMSLADMEDFKKEHPNEITSIRYSSPVYTYTSSGYISGFRKPFFFSKYRDKLNAIEDSFALTDENLGDFQGSLIATDETVLKADLMSSMDLKGGLAFMALNEHSPPPEQGKAPSSFHEIGISDELAKKIYGSSEKALNQTLNTLILDEIEVQNGQYHNHFASGSLIVSGIYESDRLALYQGSLFPLSYCFEVATLKPEEIRVEEALLKVDLDKHDASYYQNAIRLGGSYEGSFPMLVMVQEIKKTLTQLSELFFVLALLSLFSAAGLLVLSLTLILSEEKKEIGILLSLGYEREEISHFYLSFSLAVGGLGYLFSLILSALTEYILKDTLSDLLSAYVFSLKPYLISFLTSFLLTLIIGKVLSLKIRKVSPIEAFRRG